MAERVASEQLVAIGRFTVSQVTALCDGCSIVRRALRYEGRHGYVVLCTGCATFARPLLAASLLLDKPAVPEQDDEHDCGDAAEWDSPGVRR